IFGAKLVVSLNPVTLGVLASESQETEKPSKSESKTHNIPEQEPEPVKKSEEELKKEAVKEKKILLDPTNVSILTNKADDAIKYYGKPLAEHRTPEILTKSNEIQKLKVKCEKESYYNPELFEKAQEAGNKLFKKNDFASTVQQYTEAIKHNKNDPKFYSNHAACYTKLMVFQEALKDCETCIKIQGHMRKCQEAMY
ncbi:1459_t:CDS:2, partial [Racocetra fulgida]